MNKARKIIRGMCRIGMSLLAPAMLASGAVASESGLVEAGKKQFRRCAACHTVSAAARPALGPHLEGIVGRTAGSVEGFEYSELLRDQSFVWDEARLDEWLEHPAEVMPGMCQAFMGLRKPEDRAALIAFLKAPL
jgi:cytochrome c